MVISVGLSSCKGSPGAAITLGDSLCAGMADKAFSCRIPLLSVGIFPAEVGNRVILTDGYALRSATGLNVCYATNSMRLGRRNECLTLGTKAAMSPPDEVKEAYLRAIEAANPNDTLYVTVKGKFVPLTSSEQLHAGAIGVLNEYEVEFLMSE